MMALLDRPRFLLVFTAIAVLMYWICFHKGLQQYKYRSKSCSTNGNIWLDCLNSKV